MAIAPLNHLSYYSNINFNGRSKKKTQPAQSNPGEFVLQESTGFSKLPLVILFSMIPTIAATAQSKDCPQNPTSVVIGANKSLPIDSYKSIPKVPKEMTTLSGPYGFDCLNYEKINLTKKFKVNNEEQTLLFTSKDSANNVHFVYIIPQNEKGQKYAIYDQPPEVTKLRLHHIGQGKEFYSAVLEQDARDPETEKYIGTYVYELKLPDNVAQEIVDLVTSNSKYNNKSLIKIDETTSVELLTPKFWQ